MKTFLLTVLILFTISSITFAQSQYLQKDENGFEFGFGMQFGSNNSGDVTSLSLAYGVHGVLDLGFQVGKESEITILSPFLNFFLIKQDDKNGTGMNLSGFFKPEYAKLDRNSVTAFTFGGMISRDNVSESGIGFFPYFMYSYTMVESVSAKGYGGGVAFHLGKKTTGSFNFGFFKIAEQTTLNFSYTLLFKHKNNSVSSETYNLD